jgi:ABC-type glutathione transport system ATPase component
MSLLSVENLKVHFYSREGTAVAVDDASFSVEVGQVLGIVGESGSGKSVSCYSVLGLVPSPPGKVEAGRAMFAGQDLLQLKESQLRRIRGKRIGMIFQDPMTSLNPYMRVSDQLVEVLREHGIATGQEARARAVAALEEVGIRDAANRVDSYPHEFSGGMRQRVMIAMALIAEPELLIADEPTTALDVTVQAQILDLIKKLQISHNLGVVFISHDLGVVANMADHIMVMKDGRVVERGNVEEIFHNPQQDYTRSLIAAIPQSAKAVQGVSGAKAGDFLKVRHLQTYFPVYKGAVFKRLQGYVKAVDDVSLHVRKGEILGIVGESGSGKSTLGRSIMRLVESQAGEVLMNGVNLRALSAHQLKEARRDVQMIFQDPYASLNPRMTVFDTLAEPLLVHGLADKRSVVSQVNVLMDDVGLPRRFIRKYPHEFSGGQRQRIAIARALALKPRLVIADEPVSALDVTIQAQVLKLLLDLTQKHNLTMLFISHDLSVVRYICDRVLVMQQGKIVEEGETETVFNHPQHPYTQKLLTAIPRMPASTAV